jgi:hypothetical protein
MTKHVLALLFASVAIVTFTTSSMAQRWGWSELAGPIAWTSHNGSMASVRDIGAYAGSGTSVPVTVVPVDLDPAALKAPGVLAQAVPALEEALHAIRVVVADDPLLVTNLEVRGLSPDNVLGLTHSPEGITLFVSSV